MHWFKSQLNPPTKIYQMYTKLLIHAKTKIYIAYQGKYIKFFFAMHATQLFIDRSGGPHAHVECAHAWGTLDRKVPFLN